MAATRRPVLATAWWVFGIPSSCGRHRRGYWIFLSVRADMTGHAHRATQKLRRSHRRERPELADEVGLVEVARLGGYLGAARFVVQRPQRGLKPAHPGV